MWEMQFRPTKDLGLFSENHGYVRPKILGQAGIPGRLLLIREAMSRHHGHCSILGLQVVLERVEIALCQTVKMGLNLRKRFRNCTGTTKRHPRQICRKRLNLLLERLQRLMFVLFDFCTRIRQQLRCLFARRLKAFILFGL